MPTYEYRCPEGHQFERFAKMSEAAAELPCPKCGKLAARQLSGGAGLVFKGSGFYLTDYGKNAHRKGGPEGAAKSESSGESTPEKSAETKGDDAKSAESKASDAKPSESSSSKTSEKTTSTSSSSSTPKKSDT